MSPLLVIISGAVASGKTTLSRRLAADLGLPLLNRDHLKEIVFDTLGWSDRAWSRRVGSTSYQLLYYALELLLQTGHSCIAESNFQAQWDRPKLQQLCEKYSYGMIEVCCTTTPEQLHERFVRRIADGTRHPGHADAAELEMLTPADWTEQPHLVNPAGSHLIVDTTNKETMCYSTLLATLRQHLERG